MAKIEVTGCVFKKYKQTAEKVAKETIKLMKQPDEIEVAIEFVSKNKIKKLNSVMRGIDKVTDVLSFPSTEIVAGEILKLDNTEVEYLKTDDGFIHFGDMALCLAQCKKQAREYKVDVLSEVKKLVIHSMLHLMGYDHIDDGDYEVMNKKEKELDEKIKI
jgi:probable rRNA maturation factor